MTVFGGTTTSPIVLCAGLWSFSALWVLAALSHDDCSRDGMDGMVGMEFCRCWREEAYIAVGPGFWHNSIGFPTYINYMRVYESV